MPHKSSYVETTASRARTAWLTRRSGAALIASGSRTETWDSNSSVVMIFFLHRRLRTQMVTHRLKDRTADCPSREGNQENHTDRAQPPRIEGLLGQGRLDKARDINLLAVRVDARPIEGLEGMLIGSLGKIPLAFELLIRAHD